MFRYLFQADHLASELSNNSATSSINHHHANAFREKHQKALISGDNNLANQQESIAGSCQWLYELLISENRTTSSLKSFAEFELFVRHHYIISQQQQQPHQQQDNALTILNNSSSLLATIGNNTLQATTTTSTYSDKLTIPNHNDNKLAFSSSPLSVLSPSTNSYLQPSSSHPFANEPDVGRISSKLTENAALMGNNSQLTQLQDCFHQLQLEDYYSQYDIYIGLRIASTLTILFIIFILFVIYKTGCRNNGSGHCRTSRSQLQLTSSAAAQSKAQSFRYYN